MPKYPPKHLQTPEWDDGLTLLADMLLRSWMEEQAENRLKEGYKEKVATKKRPRKKQPVEQQSGGV